MAIENRQNFLKGINRRFSREDSANPEFFYTLQNARLYNRGDTGKIQRINGFTEFSATQVVNPNPLDLIEFQTFFIAFYEDGDNPDTFYVEIFNSAGTSVDNFSYSGSSTTTGKLTQADDTVFIAPHNKILYYDGSSWSLEDFISGVPTISSQSQNDVSAKAEAKIEPTGTVADTNLSQPARARITVLKNNTIVDNPDSFTVSVGGNTTASITVNYQDTEEDIAQKIYNELILVSAITTDWNISLSKNQLNTFRNDSQTVYLVAKNTGPNSDQITINGSAYNIVKFDDSQNQEESIFTDGSETFADIRETTVSTIDIQQPSGGVDGTSTVIGPLYIRFSNIDHTVKTENILSGDTATIVANKIESALSADTYITDRFSISKPLNEITLTSLETGKKYNGEISLKFFGNQNVDASELFDVTKTNFTGGIEADENLTLEPYTDYWYKARYKYIDGHVSEDCFPVKINTKASRGVTITFDTNDLDLDGSLPKIQIFRKKEGGQFFLIDEIDATGATTDYTDDGKPEKSIFNESGLIWTKKHKTQETIDERYVKANITYNTEVYTDVDETSNTDFELGTQPTSNDESLPNNSRARFFIRPQYSDGTKGYFQPIGDLNISSTGLIPTVDQSTVLTNADKTIEEIGLFVNYKPHAEEHIYKFNTFEFANQNIPTIADSSFFPTRPRLLFGFKYIEVWDNDEGVIKVAGWDSSGTARDHGGFSIGEVDNTSGSVELGNRFPQTLNINVNGITFEYVRYGYRDAGAQGENAVYKLGNFEAIKKAVGTGNLKIRLSSSNVGNLSTSTPDKDIIGEEVKVTSLIDTSSQYSDLDIFTEDDDVLIGPLDSRIYIELEDSVLDEIDNKNLNRYSFKRDYDDLDVFSSERLDGFPKEDGDITSFTMTWEFVNLKEVTGSTFNAYSGDGNDKDGGRPESGAFGRTFYKYDWDYAKFELSSVTYLDDESTVIFLGRKENQDDTGTPVPFNVTGLSFEEENELQYTKLLPSNIYNKLVTQDQLNINKTEFKNQLIWSEKLRKETGFSGGRTFTTEAFFNIGNENGEIIDIVSLANKLYVFCERGVAVINIGEVLTSQKGGEVFVDSSSFMTNYYWISDRMIDIKEESIVKYKNNIFFSDGYDVYSLSSSGLNNISNGIVSFDPTNEFYGAVNSKYNEYQLCDYTNNETWCYNFEFQQWYGPFTYVFKNSSYLRNTFITFDDSLYEHDIGNLFGTDPYTTLIESVASDTSNSFYDKTYRKFYIDHVGDGTFGYGKTTATTSTETLSNMKSKNGYKQQGIAPTQNNSKVIFWDISTTTDGFELKDISWRLQVKKRRR